MIKVEIHTLLASRSMIHLCVVTIYIILVIERLAVECSLIDASLLAVLQLLIN